MANNLDPDQIELHPFSELGACVVELVHKLMPWRALIESGSLGECKPDPRGE